MVSDPLTDRWYGLGHKAAKGVRRDSLMLIVCPKCTTNYEVEAASIGATGRSVRCARCKGVWFAAPPADRQQLAGTEPPASDETVAAFRAELADGPPVSADDIAVVETAPPIADETLPAEPAAAEAAEPAAAPSEPSSPSLDDLVAASQAEPANEAAGADADPVAAEPEPADTPALALSEISIPVEAGPASAPPPDYLKPAGAADNVEIVAARRIGQRGSSRGRSRMGSAAQMPAIIIALVVAVATLFAARISIVRQAPQMASFYGALGVPVNLRGLKFTDIKISRDVHDNVPVLVVEGTIVSASTNPVEVPRLRFALRNAVGNEVYAWTAQPSQSALLPGETLSFRSRLASPPNEMRDIQVRFFTRRDAVAGLR